ncbi:MAG TPA: hypothetical protein DCP90_02865 [Clostridiales bacterium]|nr:hypothetical protein [Clostridiales bacterium]
MKEKVVEFLKKEKCEGLPLNEISRYSEIIKKKYNVIMPNDYIDFLQVANGYCFQGCDAILGLEKKDKYMDLIAETNEFLGFIGDWEIDYVPCKFVVVGTIFEHGYVLYLEEKKEYVLIRDLFDDFTLDGKDERLLVFKSIYDFFVYYDNEAGDNKLSEDFVNKKEQEYLEIENENNKKIIEKLDLEVLNNQSLCFPIVIDNKYIEIIEKEYKKEKFNICFGNYEVNKIFKVYIDKTSRELGIAYNSKVETHNKYGLFGANPPIIKSILEEKEYFIINTDRNFLEPIIIFKSIMSNQQIQQLRKMFKEKSFFGKLFSE